VSTTLVAVVSQVASGCTEAIPEGRSEYFNAGTAAISLALVAGLLASTAGIGLQLKLSQHSRNEADNRGRWPRRTTSLLLLFAALVLGVLDAFMNASLTGVGECGVAAVQICITAVLLAICALLLFCALAWLIVETTTAKFDQSELKLFLGIAVLLGALAAPVFLTVILSYAHIVVFGSAFSLSEYFALVTPAVVLVGASAFARHVILRRGWGESWRNKARSNWPRIALSLTGLFAVLGLVACYMFTALIQPSSLRSPSQLDPAWLGVVAMVCSTVLVELTILAFPPWSARVVSIGVQDDGVTHADCSESVNREQSATENDMPHA